MSVCQGCGADLPPPARAQTARGIRTGRPRKWCSERCRKDSYAGTCIVCGGLTDGTTPSRGVATVCASCSAWSADAIVDAMRRWFEERGVPPTEAEWRESGPDHPSGSCVVRRIGWNEALLRAGLPLRCDRRPETQEWIEAQVAAGATLREVADVLGVTSAAIQRRLQYRGKNAAALRGQVAA